MDIGTMIVIAVVLFAAILVPFLIYEIRRGKASGHVRETRQKPMGHADIGDDTGRGPGGSTAGARGPMPEGFTHDDTHSRPGTGVR
jgi:hypothetical protein